MLLLIPRNRIPTYLQGVSVVIPVDHMFLRNIFALSCVYDDLPELGDGQLEPLLVDFALHGGSIEESKRKKIRLMTCPK